jgi:predicted Zn-dependent peptidase
MKTMTLLTVAVLAGAAPLSAQQPDRSAPPKLAEPPTLSLPPIHEQRFSNGLRVLLMEKHEVPVVAIGVMVRAGSANDPADRIGLASLVADMMDEGAGSRNALALADAVDFLGAQLSTTASTQVMGVSLYTAVSRLNDALPLLADVVLRPTFPADELERKRTSRLTSLLQAYDEPRIVASVLFNRALYGTKHPYGFPAVGDEASIRAVSVDDLKRFHDTYFTAGNATVIVVGDVTAATLLPKIEAAFGTWAAGSPAKATLPAASQVARREVLLVDKPGAPQSEIRIGRIGVARQTEDYYPIVVMNTILGGSFTSRLNQNLREDKGYTYGASSSFAFRLTPGPFLAASAVQTEVTDKALAEFFKEFDGIRRPIPVDEITRAKSYEALGYPGGFQSVDDIAGNIAELVQYGLPLDYFNHYVARILGVTPPQVEGAARRYVDPNTMVIVVVGDRAKIEAPIRALKLGPVRVMTVEDVLGKKPQLGSE